MKSADDVIANFLGKGRLGTFPILSGSQNQNFNLISKTPIFSAVKLYSSYLWQKGIKEY